jgi:hypothetical protein
VANRPILHQSRLLHVLLLTLLCLVSAYVVRRALTPRAPVFFAQARSSFVGARWHEGNWYWLEGAGTPGARLVRANASVTLTVAAGDRIGAYSLAEGKVVWTVRDGSRWTVDIGGADGSGKRTLWSGEREPRGLCLAAGRVFWLEQAPPAVPESGALPPLAATLKLVSVPTEGGSPGVIATLLETEGGQVIGVHDGQIYLSAFRPGTYGVTAIYRVALTGGNPRRVVGETGRQRVLLTREGLLYWVSPSPEDNGVGKSVCIRRLGREDRPETLADWLPANGQLYETDHGVCYVDSSSPAAAWPLTGGKELPRSVPLPGNYTVLAAGDGEMLLESTGTTPTNIPVYRMALP